MAQFTRPGNPQAYGFVATDVIPFNGFAVFDTAASAVGGGGAFGAARPVVATAVSASMAFVGVFDGQNPPSSPINNANPLQPINSILVLREGEFLCQSTAAEVYVHGTAVYAIPGGDSLTITNVSTANLKVGYVNLPLGTQITGAAGVTVPVEIQPTGAFATSILSA